MSRSLNIGILGTRGIPNRYGGFEQCAEYLAFGLVNKGHKVSVYNSSSHEYKKAEWNGVRIIHCYDPENKLGTAGQFIYDLNCINDARGRGFDILLQLGYTSNSIWFWRWPRNSVNIVNMDGLEWLRSKYSPKVKRFLKHAEKWAALHSDVLIADSPGIQEHLLTTYRRPSVFIPYGAEVPPRFDPAPLDGFSLQPYEYSMLIARMEPENNIETIIRGYIASAAARPLIVVGNTGNAYGSLLKGRYRSNSTIVFTGGIYDIDVLNNLRYFSRLYFHGHSVGGTNPSLLEAMACHTLIVAHDNVFNKAVLGEDAFYFSDASSVASVIRNAGSKESYQYWLEANLNKIRTRYNWVRIVEEYESLMLKSVS